MRAGFVFLAVRGELPSAAATVVALAAAIRALRPGQLAALQAGKYTRGCFIEPHDDTGFKEVEDAATG